LKTIVVALDASPAASVAARAAVDLAAASNGRVIFAHVALPADDTAQAAAFAAAAAYALAAGVQCDSVVLQGEPVYAIINSVKTSHADLVTVGAQGRIEKPFGFGSIAQAVVRTSPVPVLVIPAPAAATGSRLPEATGMGLP
jgi:nucleotide-binding universal stress UspA family protein